jgi:hypothetical protein
MLRIAIMRRRRLDWLLFWISLALVIAATVVIGSISTEGEEGTAEEDDPRPVDFVFLAVLLGLAIGVPTHYLVADIRHHQEPRPAWRPPQAGSPYNAPTVPYGLPPQTPPTPGYGYPPVPPQHRPAYQPAPAPEKPRIDQVRAELDELSDYLRKDRTEQDRGQGR